MRLPRWALRLSAPGWPWTGRSSGAHRLAAATFAFTVSLGEFGATALLTRPEYPTIPIAIYRFLSQPGGLNYGQAMAMATLLMVLATVGILLIERLRLPGTQRILTTKITKIFPSDFCERICSN